MLSSSCLQVSKAVFASTTKSQLNLNNQRADESKPTLTYPDISFAVEDFEEAFESLVSLQKTACLLCQSDCKSVVCKQAVLSLLQTVLRIMLHRACL